MICQGMIAERHTFDEEGNPITIPEHPCEEEATLLSRSMEEQECNLDAVHWVKVGDEYYCSMHFKAGTMTDLNGNVSQHAPMSVIDA